MWRADNGAEGKGGREDEKEKEKGRAVFIIFKKET